MPKHRRKRSKIIKGYGVFIKGKFKAFRTSKARAKAFVDIQKA